MERIKRILDGEMKKRVFGAVGVVFFGLLAVLSFYFAPVHLDMIGVIVGMGGAGISLHFACGQPE